jgi:hypothetical protein
MRRTKPPRGKVGTPISVRFGSQLVPGTIIEDRGPLGVGGRRLYRVEVSIVPGETDSFDMPEDDLIFHEEAQPA